VLPSNNEYLSVRVSLLLSSAQMRAAAILGQGCSPKNLRPFQIDKTDVEWRIGLPAASDEADVILLFGGDGTIHRHLRQLVNLGLPVLIVPTGSGNDFTRALGFGGVRESLAAWQKFCAGQQNVRAIDLGVVTALQDASESPAPHQSTRHYFSTVAGIGLDCEVARRANEMPRWLRGHGGYALALAPALFRLAPLPVKISEVDEQGNPTLQSKKPIILAAFANASTYGDGMKIAPEAKMDDGQLDVCVIAGIDPFKLFCMFPTVYFGRHLKIEGVEYFRVPRVRVETESPADIYADGEYVCNTPVDVSVQPSALRVICPAL
jgi:diacylglycerol kinase (ATP)